MNHSPFFNAHHSPIGAFASLTLGCKGALGGFGIELKGPANESLYIGAEEAERPGFYRALPFFDDHHADADSLDFDVEGMSDFQFSKTISPYSDTDVARDFGAGIDTWSAKDLTFRIISPVGSVPDPATASDDELKAVLVPAIYAELTLDNRKGSSPRKVFFGFAGSDRTSNMRIWKDGGLTGLGQGRSIGIATDADGVSGANGFQAEAALNPRSAHDANFMLGGTAALVATVPAGEVRTIRFAIGFFREGWVTTGIDARYLYRRWFDRLESVLDYALGQIDQVIETAVAMDRRIKTQNSPERAFMIAHSLRSYFGSSQLLEMADGRPLWVVNEGEYRMMNTFDLTVDQVFLELALNPWTVRNVLDFFVERYSYTDGVRFPESDVVHPGGLAFTHDMGVCNAFSPQHYSSYEQSNLRGVFSYMTCEELVNWALCAALYVSNTKDQDWAEHHRAVFSAVVKSLMNRDHPEAARRNGVMGLDSDRCRGGAEITTYDSLDASLGQARNNLYLAVKTWAVYVLLDPILGSLGEDATRVNAVEQAQRAAKTIVDSADADGFLPAVIGEGVVARIIPAIEGLVFPLAAGRVDLVAGDGPYTELIRTLARHLDLVMKPGICLFADGGWRLSSTSRNSWLSKIYLCQYVAERQFGKAADARADAAHVGWLMDADNIYYAWSDQMVAGKAQGSRYYPRGVTSTLWMAKDASDPVAAIRSAILG